jgi:hypothetical protein
MGERVPASVAPAWVTALVEEICSAADLPAPRVRWRRRPHEHSTGVTRRSQGSVAVSAGQDALDQRLTLLHELAHWLSPPPRRGRRAAHHSRTFYATAFDLYARHGIPAADALRLESGRYPSSLRHAAALGVPGADRLLADRRATLRARPRRRWRVLVPEHPIRLARAGRWSVCATCGQRVVAATLARLRRSRRPYLHTLLTAEADGAQPVGVRR